MRLLDLYCGAGGAAMGYYRAGFIDIVGVDNVNQKRYPFEFVQADALEYLAEHGHEFDVIHSSPPCQRWSVETPPEYRDGHPDLIKPTRGLLKKVGKPYVIENVQNARSQLKVPLMLCGTMFGLKIWRHRYFEIEPRLAWLTPPCQHNGFIPVLITGTTKRKGFPRKDPPADVRRKAMEVPWMTITDMDQAIPPAYTEWIGWQLVKVLEVTSD